MEHFVTLFDSAFLPQGLALHTSMERWAGRYTLWIVCMDDAAEAVLARLALRNVRLLPLSKVETDSLRRVKPTRTRGEYCWTLTPFTPRFVFDAEPSAGRVTYVDADTWLVRSPRTVFAEFEASGKSVLITEHAYAPRYDQSASSGRYCVQFMSFLRDRGDNVRSWWADRCIEWCHARVEDGKFGDQMYLDDWPTRFGADVHVLHNRAAMQAPWNSLVFAPGDAVLFHFHGLRLLRGNRLLSTDHYRINPPTFRSIYQPYFDDFRSALDTLRACGHVTRPQIDRPAWLQRLRVLAQQAKLRWRDRPPPRFHPLGG
jgi:hypothetical protein